MLDKIYVTLCDKDKKKKSTQTDLGSNHLFSKGRYKLCSEAEYFD